MGLSNLRIPKDILFPASALVLTSVISYIVLYTVFGYTYELLLFSNVVFVCLGLSILTLGGFRENIIYHILFAVVVLYLMEEVLLNSAFAWYGLILAFIGFIVFPFVGIFSEVKGEAVRAVLEICGLLFATRIVFSPFPVELLMSSSILPVIYSLIMGSIVFYLWFRKLPLGEIGFKRGSVRLPYQVVLGLLIGLVIGLIEYPILRPQPVEIASNPLNNIVYIVITMTIFVGLTEEVMFRGLLQNQMKKMMPRGQAVILSAMIFGLFHIGWLNALEVVFAFGAGVIFGYLLIKTESLITPTISHGFGNIVLFTLAMLL